MRFIGIVIILVICSHSSLLPAQKKNVIETVDVLELLDGTTIRGKIVSQSDKHFILLDSENNEFTIDKTAVLSQDKVIRLTEDREEKKLHKVHVKGFLNEFQLGALFNEDHVGSSVGYNLKYYISQHFGVGLGVAYDVYQNGISNKILPFTVEVSGLVIQKKIAPFYNLGIGYGIALENSNEFVTQDAKGGIIMNPKIGLKFHTHKSFSYAFYFGIKFQKAKYTDESPWAETTDTRNITFKRFSIGTALSF